VLDSRHHLSRPTVFMSHAHNGSHAGSDIDILFFCNIEGHGGHVPFF